MASAPTHRAPQARDAADDEHREREERQLEVDLVGGDRAEHVDVQRRPRSPASAPESANAHRRCRWTSIPDRLRRRRVLARRAQLAPEAAALVRERDRDHDERADRRLQQSGRLGDERERRRARARSSSTRAGGCA